jgi:hypothetical protein
VNPKIRSAVVRSLAIGLLTSSATVAQAQFVNPPQQCQGPNKLGYGDLCSGTYDAGPYVFDIPNGTCCEGVCGADSSKGGNHALCCGLDGDIPYPGQSAPCVQNMPPWLRWLIPFCAPVVCADGDDTFCTNDFACCSNSERGGPYPNVACQCIAPGFGTPVINGQPTTSPYACCGNEIADAGSGPDAEFVCVAAPNGHSCQRDEGCATVDGRPQYCYKPGGSFGTCQFYGQCLSSNSLPDAGSCANGLPCCDDTTCNQTTGKCVAPPVCYSTIGHPCSLDYYTTPCCGPTYDGGFIMGVGFGLACDPRSNTCRPAVGEDGGSCVQDNPDGGEDPEWPVHTLQGNCVQGDICYDTNVLMDGGVVEDVITRCQKNSVGQCCYFPFVQCQYPLDCNEPPVPPGGNPDAGSGSGCNSFDWDPGDLNCCQGPGYLTVPGVMGGCIPSESYECCDSQCLRNPNYGLVPGATAYTCDGTAWPICQPLSGGCTVQADCCTGLVCDQGECWTS